MIWLNRNPSKKRAAVFGASSSTLTYTDDGGVFAVGGKLEGGLGGSDGGVGIAKAVAREECSIDGFRSGSLRPSVGCRGPFDGFSISLLTSTMSISSLSGSFTGVIRSFSVGSDFTGLGSRFVIVFIEMMSPTNESIAFRLRLRTTAGSSFSSVGFGCLEVVSWKMDPSNTSSVLALATLLSTERHRDFTHLTGLSLLFLPFSHHNNPPSTSLYTPHNPISILHIRSSYPPLRLSSPLVERYPSVEALSMPISPFQTIWSLK